MSFRTKGDGGCGLHAIWGEPNQTRELSLPCGQQLGRESVSNLLPDNLGELQQVLVAWPHLESVVTSLWSELAVPGAQGN